MYLYIRGIGHYFIAFAVRGQVLVPCPYIPRHPRAAGVLVVCPTRFELATYRVGVCHSIQLSYGHIFTDY